MKFPRFRQGEIQTGPLPPANRSRSSNAVTLLEAGSAVVLAFQSPSSQKAEFTCAPHSVVEGHRELLNAFHRSHNKQSNMQKQELISLKMKEQFQLLRDGQKRSSRSFSGVRRHTKGTARPHEYRGHESSQSRNSPAKSQKTKVNRRRVSPQRRHKSGRVKTSQSFLPFYLQQFNGHMNSEKHIVQDTSGLEGGMDKASKGQPSAPLQDSSQSVNCGTLHARNSEVLQQSEGELQATLSTSSNTSGTRPSICSFPPNRMTTTIPMDRATSLDTLHKLAAANNNFAWNLYQQLSKKEGNVFLSPLSISIAMAMTYLGARGNTQAQMKSGLCFQDFDDESLHQSFNQVLSTLQNTNGKFTLHLANRLYGDKSYKFLEDFTKASLKHYGAELAPVDFSDDAPGCVDIINTWVSKQTAEKIPKLLSRNDVDSRTKLVLVNAIYFKADWKTQFDPSMTQKDADFYVTKDQSVKVPLMYMNGMKVDYMRNGDLGCQAIRLPYVDDQLSMIVILPDELDGLQNLESKLTMDELKELKDGMHNAKVDVWLPRFKLDGTFKLKDALSSLGMSDAFIDGEADFSGIDGSHNLLISDAIHQATIEVNEEGSEAAAATAVVMMARCATMRPPRFRADHPFLFCIQDNSTGAILFFGRFAKP